MREVWGGKDGIFFLPGKTREAGGGSLTISCDNTPTTFNTPGLQGFPQYVRLLAFQATIAVDLPHCFDLT